MSKGKKIFLAAAIIIVVVAALFGVSILLSGDKDFSKKYAGADLSVTDSDFGRDDVYSSYLDHHKNTARPQVAEIPIEVTKFVESSAANTEIKTDFQGEDKVLYQGDNGYTEWNVSIPETGMYRLYIEYYPVESRGVSMERAFRINGQVPFVGTDALTFTRRWKDAGEVVTDNQGNDRRPLQVEDYAWCSSYFTDYMGYFTDPYEYYFEAGENTIALKCVNEPMIIRKISVCPVTEKLTYDTYRASQPNVNGGTDYIQKVQGENSSARSESSLYARSDHSSPSTEPYSIKSQKLNYIGGTQWRVPGQWLEWTFEVPADGFYNITLKSRQNQTRGVVSNRAVYIDGEIPFEELSAVQFRFSNDWENVTLADDKGTPFEFYLKAGSHTIRMEVTLGDTGAIINEMQNSVGRMNEMYLTILGLTGTTPDRYRDYHFDQVFPEIISGMTLESKRLYKQFDDYVSYSGQKSGSIAVLHTIARMLEKFGQKPEKIAKQFASFKTNISSLGTTINNLCEAPLDIDYITITGTGKKPEKFKTGFLSKASHEIRSFAASFVVDYNNIGNTYDKKADALTVWMLQGRDQSNALKALIDDTFTPEYGIPINLRLVNQAMVRSAVIAGTGPDIVIYMNQTEPVDYALRSGVEDLTQFSDWQDVFSQFNESAYEPYWFEGGLYAIPLTQVYNVMFYRKDILNNYGLEIPQTWDQLIDMLPTLQQDNLEVAIPSTERKIGNAMVPDLSAFIALLYQNQGSLYNDSKTKTLIASENGVKAFDIYTRFYTHYSLPKMFDFANRFRSGEMPIGLQDYDTYNTIVMLAPEIRGLWDFTIIPGSLQEDGTLDHTCSSWGYNSMMLKQDDKSEEHKQNCWTFLKWWADSATQSRFGREIEAILGPSSRYQTANTISFRELPWSSDEMSILEEQWSYAARVPEVAGGYFVTRHITNAARRVYMNNEDPRETLLDYADTINDEIVKKRAEFGLSVD